MDIASIKRRFAALARRHGDEWEELLAQTKTQVEALGDKAREEGWDTQQLLDEMHVLARAHVERVKELEDEVGVALLAWYEGETRH